jgi:hypothetical protein
MRVARKVLAERTFNRLDYVGRRPKPERLRVANVEVDYLATSSFQSLGGMNNIPDRVMKISGAF